MGIYKVKDTYYIDYYYKGRRLREAAGTNKRLAKEALAKRKTEMFEGKFFGNALASKVTFDELAAEYMEWARVNKKSCERDERSIKLLGETLGGMKLKDITPRLIEKYKNRRLKEVKGSTINRELACLKGMFTKAIFWDMALENPVKKVKMFREDNCRIRFLKPDEIKALLSESSDDLKPLIITALNTGMRYSEITGMRWVDVDLKAEAIHVPDTKSGKPRDVPMNQEMLDLLSNLERKSEYVFCRPDGSRIKSIRTAFEKAKRRAGIKDFRFHDLRHTFASYMVMSGNDILAVKELLGHSSMAMVLRYAHLSREHRTRAIKKLKFEHGHKSATRDSGDDPRGHSSDCDTDDCRSGGTGRRKGLKIPRSFALCRFDSGLRHLFNRHRIGEPIVSSGPGCQRSLFRPAN